MAIQSEENQNHYTAIKLKHNNYTKQLITIITKSVMYMVLNGKLHGEVHVQSCS